MKLFNKIKLPMVNLIGCILCAIHPILFLFFRNASEMSFSEISRILLFSILFATIVLCIMFGIMRDWNKAGVTSILLIVICENYSFIAKAVNLIFKNAKYWHIVMVLLFIFIWACILITKIKNNELFSTATGICRLLFGALILINCVSAIPAMIKKASLSDSNMISQEENIAQVKGNSPNIYYFILDECASFNTIREYYDYTDTRFYDFYEKNGFAISDNSHNDCASTHVVLTNCINLDYVIDENCSPFDAQIYRQEHEAELYKVLLDHGYRMLGIGNTEWLGIESITSDASTIKSQTIGGKNAEELFLQQTIIPSFEINITSLKAEYIQNAFFTMQQPEIIQPNSSLFTLFYIECPHTPFLFDENGDFVSPSNYENWEDKQFYLGQYLYAMNETQKCIENILEYDPDCVILVTSDHGPRARNEFTNETKTNILNNVYFRGEAINEIKDTSQVNTLRIILNKLLNTNYEKVEIEQ